MTEMITLLQLPFVQRAFVAGVLLALVMAVLGVLTLIRKASFYGDAIAHSSLAGVALGLAVGWYPLAVAFGYAVVLATILPWIRTKFRLPLDNVLGILLPSSMGLGVLIFSLLPGFQPEMMGFLFGSIIAISWFDLALVVGMTVLSLTCFAWLLPQLLFISVDAEYAKLLKLPVRRLERVYEVLLAIIIIAGVRLLGIILINALLIVPASAAKLHARSLTHWLWLSLVLSVVTVVGGLLTSLWFNVPPGATIALFSGGLFVVSGGIRLGKR